MDKNIDKNVNMQLIFSKLSENNKDILILMAKSMKVAQEAGKQECKSSNFLKGGEYIWDRE